MKFGPIIRSPAQLFGRLDGTVVTKEDGAMIASSTRQVSGAHSRGKVVITSRNLLRVVLWGLVFCGGLQGATGADISIFPYEPVVLSVPHSTNHLAPDFSSEVVLTCPNQQQVTNQVTRMHLLGVSEGKSLFMLLDQATNYFVATGLYRGVLEGVTNTVTVLEPSGNDTTVMPILKNLTFYKILLTTGRESLDADSKATCQQIMADSPTGQFAIWAKTYLAIDALYSELSSMCDSGVTPNLATAGTQVVSLNMPTNDIRWTVLYHKGYAFGMRQATNEASAAFTTLVDGLQHSPWSKNAEKFLLELADPQGSALNAIN